MKDSRALGEARKYLSRAESAFRTAAGLRHLEDGLAFLDEAMLDGEPGQRSTAGNLLATYSTRIAESIRDVVESDPALPEPDLEHFFRMLLAFDALDVELPAFVRSLKIEVVRRLVDCYYEGHSPEDKAAALRELAAVSAPGSRQAK